MELRGGGGDGGSMNRSVHAVGRGGLGGSGVCVALSPELRIPTARDEARFGEVCA